MSAPYAVLAIGGVGLTIAGSGLIWVNFRYACGREPSHGAKRVVRALVSHIVVITGSVLILIGLAMLVSPIAARI